MAVKNDRKTIFGKTHQQILQIPCGSKILSRSRTVSEINEFYTEIQDSRKKCPVKFADILWVKNFVEIAVSRTVSEILKIFHFQRYTKVWC